MPPRAPQALTVLGTAHAKSSASPSPGASEVAGGGSGFAAGGAGFGGGGRAMTSGVLGATQELQQSDEQVDAARNRGPVSGEG